MNALRAGGIAFGVAAAAPLLGTFPLAEKKGSRLSKHEAIRTLSYAEIGVGVLGLTVGGLGFKNHMAAGIGAGLMFGGLFANRIGGGVMSFTERL